MINTEKNEGLSTKSSRIYLSTLELDFRSSGVVAVLCLPLLAGRLTTSNILKKSSLYQQFIVTLQVLMIFTLALPVTSDPLPKVPPFQDVEAALRTTMCKVREQIVDIREEHPTIPPNSKLIPSCVMLRRCSGCCQSDLHQCMPTLIYSTKVKISLQLIPQNIVNYTTLDFIHHAECRCQDPTRITCVPQLCPPPHVWNKHLCRCEKRCVPQKCGRRRRWNHDTCQCQCRKCHSNEALHSLFVQDEDSCLCMCKHRRHNRRRCRIKASSSSANADTPIKLNGSANPANR